MQSIALRAERIVKMAAEPTRVGEKIKLQRTRSLYRLEMDKIPHGDSMHKKAWFRLAGAPTLARIEEQADRVGLIIPPTPHTIMAEIQKNIERLRSIDAEFHAPQIEFHCAEIERLSRMFAR